LLLLFVIIAIANINTTTDQSVRNRLSWQLHIFRIQGQLQCS